MTGLARWIPFYALACFVPGACIGDAEDENPQESGGAAGRGGVAGSDGGARAGGAGGTSGDGATDGGAPSAGGGTLGHGGAAGAAGGGGETSGDDEATPEEVCSLWCPPDGRVAANVWIVENCFGGGDGGEGGQGGQAGAAGAGGTFDQQECIRTCLAYESTIPRRCGDESLLLNRCYVDPDAYVCDVGGALPVACRPLEDAFFQCVEG
jgi:hypothetical protein